MPKSKKPRPPKYTFISITVDNHKARTTAGINFGLLGSARHRTDPDDFVYRYESTIELSGFCHYPEERAGERYEVEIYSSHPNSAERELKVSDLQEHHGDGSPKYKKLKSGTYPIYREAPPIGFMEKKPGESRFNVAIWAAPTFLSDTLTLLTLPEQIYLSIQEKKLYRKRFVTEFNVQNTAPEMD